MRRVLLRGLGGAIARVLVTKGPLEEGIRAGIRLLIQQVGVMLVDDLDRIAESLGHASGVARMLLQVLGGKDIADNMGGDAHPREAHGADRHRAGQPIGRKRVAFGIQKDVLLPRFGETRPPDGQVFFEQWHQVGWEQALVAIDAAIAPIDLELLTTEADAPETFMISVQIPLQLAFRGRCVGAMDAGRGSAG